MLKRVLYPIVAVALSLSSSTAQPTLAEDMNLTQGQQEQIRRILIAERYFDNHIRARIDAVLTPEQRSIARDYPILSNALYHN